MVHLPKVSSDFETARMRDSFLRQFLEPDNDTLVQTRDNISMVHDSPNSIALYKFRNYPNSSLKRKHISAMIRLLNIS